MGLIFGKSSFVNTDYSLHLSSNDSVYHALSLIQGEFRWNNRGKLRIEKEIRIDLIGEIIEHKKSVRPSQQESFEKKKKRVFFSYASPLITSHHNGTPRILPKQQLIYPFRIPLGINLPPSCQFQDFSIHYHLQVYHDGRVLPNLQKTIFLMAPAPADTIPRSHQITGADDVTIRGQLAKSFYSSRDGATVPLAISIINPQEKSLQSLTIQLMQIISLNGDKQENEILSREIFPMKTDRFEKETHQICQMELPRHLPSSYVPNGEAQLDSIPFLAISYEFRLTGHIKDFTQANLQLSIPIGIE